MPRWPNHTLAERIQKHVIVEEQTGCWIWTASTRTDGYGQIRTGTKNIAAHRLSYELARGEVPAGAMLCHTCDNRRCVNPDHLFLGDHKANAHDAISKGRYAIGERGGNAKLTNAQAREIRDSAERGSDIARRFNISPSVVSQIRKGQIWKSLAK